MTATLQRKLPLLAALTLVLLLFAAGGLLTDRGPWFQALQQPSWRPPAALFGPAWFVILLLAATAGLLAWPRLTTAGQRFCFMALAALNAGFNLLWSFLFFQLQRPDWAFIDAILLWLTIAGLAVLLARQAPLAALMLLPYCLWAGYASVLTNRIVVLNGPF